MTDNEITLGLASTFMLFARELARQRHVNVPDMVRMLEALTDEATRPFAQNLISVLQLPHDAPTPPLKPFTVIDGGRD